MMRYLRWRIEDLADLAPNWLKSWWYWRQLRRLR
jgi:hypothetical protein